MWCTPFFISDLGNPTMSAFRNHRQSNAFYQGYGVVHDAINLAVFFDTLRQYICQCLVRHRSRWQLYLCNPYFSFVFLIKLHPCLSHCFRSPIVGFYQQWAFVILHNLDPDRVVPFLFLDALNDQVRIGRFSRWSLVKVLNIGSVGQEENVGTFRYFLHYLHHEG